MTDAKRHDPKPLAAEAKDTFETLTMVLVVFLVIRVGLGQPYTIPSESMEPGLLVGDYILVSKFDYGWSRWSRGGSWRESRRGAACDGAEPPAGAVRPPLRLDQLANHLAGGATFAAAARHERLLGSVGNPHFQALALLRASGVTHRWPPQVSARD